MIEKMYVLEGASCLSTDQAMIVTMGNGDHSQEIEVWHVRLGHVTLSKLNEVDKCVTGLKLANISSYDSTSDDLCSECAKGR